MRLMRKQIGTIMTNPGMIAQMIGQYISSPCAIFAAGTSSGAVRKNGGQSMRKRSLANPPRVSGPHIIAPFLLSGDKIPSKSWLTTPIEVKKISFKRIMHKTSASIGKACHDFRQLSL